MTFLESYRKRFKESLESVNPSKISDYDYDKKVAAQVKEAIDWLENTFNTYVDRTPNLDGNTNEYHRDNSFDSDLIEVFKKLRELARDIVPSVRD